MLPETRDDDRARSLGKRAGVSAPFWVFVASLRVLGRAWWMTLALAPGPALAAPKALPRAAGAQRPAPIVPSPSPRASVPRAAALDGPGVARSEREGGVQQSTSGTAVSLSAILEHADRHAPILIVARERMRLGEAAEIAARPLLPDNPVLTVGAGMRRVAGEGYTDWSAALTQTLDVSGKRGLRLNVARKTQRRLRAQLEEARWEVHREVHAAFHQAIVTRERLAAVRRLSEFQQRLLDIAQLRLRAGDVSPLEVRLAEGEASQAQVALLAAEQEYLQARLQLAAVAGWPASRPPAPAGALDEPREPPPSPQLLAMATRHQPHLKSLSARHAEAQARERSAARGAWPEPTLGVQVGQEGGPAGGRERFIVGTVGFPLPLVQRNQGERAQARAETAVAAARERAFSVQLSHRIERYRTGVVNAAARVRAYGQQILPRFEENLRLLQRAFELGEIDILQVSVARERFLRIRMDALDAYDTYFRAVAELEASIGMDLWPDEHARHAASPSTAGVP